MLPGRSLLGPSTIRVYGIPVLILLEKTLSGDEDGGACGYSDRLLPGEVRAVFSERLRSFDASVQSRNERRSLSSWAPTSRKCVTLVLRGEGINVRGA